MVGQGDLLHQLIGRARAGEGGGGALEALDHAGGDGGQALGEAHGDGGGAQALQSLGEQSGGGGPELVALQILGGLNVQVGDHAAEAEGIVGIQNVDILGGQTVAHILDQVGLHDVVILFVAVVQHGADQGGGVAHVVGEQGGLFQAHPVGVVDRLGDGVAVAVQLVLAVVGHGDMALGALGDHLSQLLGGLVVPLGGLEHV